MIASVPHTRPSPRRLQAFAFLAAVVCSISALAQVPDEITIEPDMAMQAELDAMASAMIEARPAPMRELAPALEQLLAAANGDRKFVMLQTMHWAAHAEDPAYQQLSKTIFLWFQELLNFSDEEHLDIALPYLTSRSPATVRFLARDMLELVYVKRDDRGSASYDFSVFAERIANDSGREPGELDGLIEFIYEEGPGEAVLALMRAHGASAEEIAAMEDAESYFGRMYRRGYHKKESNPELDLDKIMAYLDQYSQSDRWWERLYVAAMLGEVRQLRTDTLVRRLRSDLHPVVRGKLSGIHPKDEQ